jgi:hypothetical protein
MRKVLALAAMAAAFSFGCGQAMCAQDQTVLWPDASGKMVRIPIAHTYAQSYDYPHFESEFRARCDIDESR